MTGFSGSLIIFRTEIFSRRRDEGFIWFKTYVFMILNTWTPSQMRTCLHFHSVFKKRPRECALIRTSVHLACLFGEEQNLRGLAALA